MMLPYFLWPQRKYAKKLSKLASSPTAVGYLHSSCFSSKNTKLTAFRQLCFLHEQKQLPFSFAEVSKEIMR